MVAEAEHQFIWKLVSDVLQCFDHSYGDMSNLLSNKKNVYWKMASRYMTPEVYFVSIPGNEEFYLGKNSVV